MMYIMPMIQPDMDSPEMQELREELADDDSVSGNLMKKFVGAAPKTDGKKGGKKVEDKKKK